MKLLIESNQTIPDFLQSYQPTETNLSFDDDTTDSEAEKAKEAKTDAWAPGSDNDEEVDTKSEEGDEAWGQDAAPAESADDVRSEEDPAEEDAWARPSINKDDVLW